MTRDGTFTRRRFGAICAGGLCAPSLSVSQAYREITWDDLIPPGVPYSQIIGEGDLDEVNDTWAPIFDANGRKMNHGLAGQIVRLPGYIIPIEHDRRGVTEFLLVPYVGACIHVPPPPPNQLVFVNTVRPWPNTQLWDPIWVTGTLSIELQSTTLGDIG